MLEEYIRFGNQVELRGVGLSTCACRWHRYELMEGGDLFNRIYDSRKGRKEAKQ